MKPDFIVITLAIDAANDFCARMYRDWLREIGLIDKWREEFRCR